jgi:imidazolonepropionase-like amidohydrolase
MKRNEVLNTVTTTAARLLGLDESLGRVSPGYLADLLLIDRHPFDDLSALSSPDIVIMNGVAYDGHALRDITRRHGTFTETVLV